MTHTICPESVNLLNAYVLDGVAQLLGTLRRCDKLFIGSIMSVGLNGLTERLEVSDFSLCIDDHAQQIRNEIGDRYVVEVSRNKISISVKTK